MKVPPKMNQMPVDKIKRRLHSLNRNWLAVIVGEPGSGKSYTAMRLAELIDPMFNITKVVFTTTEFMSLLNSGILQKGDVIVWEEAGVGISSKDWYSISNKSINYIAQTFRHDNLAVIFTVPNFEYMDSALRKLFHAYIETVRIDTSNKRCIVKWLNIQYNGRLKKIFMKYPKVKIRGVEYKFNRIKVGLPSESLLDDYEKKKRQYTDKLKKTVEGNIKLGEALVMEEHKKKMEEVMSKDIVITPEESEQKPKPKEPKYGVKPKKKPDFSDIPDKL